MTSEAPGAEILRLEHVTKRFPGVTAVSDVSLDLRAGEVHVLFGENGAGKSTLVNIIAGAYAPDEGEVLLSGESMETSSVSTSRALGVGTVFQTLSLVPTLSVAENIFLGREEVSGVRLRRGAMVERAAELMEELGFGVSPTTRVDQLSRADAQAVEIAKALRTSPRVLILDEPTTSLTEEETNTLFSLVRKLTERGTGVIYITHRMQEIWELADRITVLRDGRWIATVRPDEVDEDSLVTLMTGREITSIYPDVPRREGPEKLRLEGVSVAGSPVEDVSLSVRGGEIVGIAGLVGSGKGDIGRAIVGAAPLSAGVVKVGDREIRRPDPRRMSDEGVVYFSSDRAGEGLFPARSVLENLSVASLHRPHLRRGPVLRRDEERERVATMVREVQLRPPDLDRPVSTLSGGNQQKVVLGRGLLLGADVLVFDEPTAGVDVGARTEIYGQIALLAEQGAAVLIISSDLPEILNLCHRALVVRRGHVSAELTGDELTEEAALAAFF